MLRLFGNDIIGDPLSNATTTGLSRKVNQRINSLFYLKEFRRDIEKTIEGFILSGYDGSGRLTGDLTNDNSTYTMTILSGAILDGNDMPAGKSETFSRIILMNFEKNKWNQTQSQRFNLLENEIEHGFHNVLREILKYRSVFKNKIIKTFREILTELKNDPETDGFDERAIKHTALILTPQSILENYLKFPKSLSYYKKIVIQNQKDHNDQLKESDSIHVFWLAFQSYYQELTKGTDYFFKIENNDGKIGSLYIDFNKIYGKCYIRHCRDIGITALTQAGLKKSLFSENYQPFKKTTQNKQGLQWNVKVPLPEGNYKSLSRYRFDFEIINSELSIENILIHVNDLSFEYSNHRNDQPTANTANPANQEN